MFKNKSNLKGCYTNPNMDNGLGESGSCVKQTLVNGRVPAGGCSASDGGPGYKNTTGFPPCCVENPSDACKNIVSNVSKAADKMTQESTKAAEAVVDKVVQSVSNVVKAAKNCVAKNPNYPSEIGGCVYNPNNPCPSKYEVTDSRFGIKMCCDVPNANNQDCFQSKSTFGKSTFGISDIPYYYYIIIGVVIFLLIILFLKRRKSVNVAKVLFGLRRK